MPAPRWRGPPRCRSPARRRSGCRLPPSVARPSRDSAGLAAAGPLSCAPSSAPRARRIFRRGADYRASAHVNIPTCQTWKSSQVRRPRPCPSAGATGRARAADRQRAATGPEGLHRGRHGFRDDVRQRTI